MAWKNEYERHAMARMGIKTGSKLNTFENLNKKQLKLVDKKTQRMRKMIGMQVSKPYNYPSHIDEINKNKNEYLDDVSDSYNLTPQQSKALRGLFKERFFTFSPSYVREWAERIRNGSAWAHSDSQTRAVLKKYGLGYEVSPSGTNDDVWKN